MALTPYGLRQVLYLGNLIFSKIGPTLGLSIELQASCKSMAEIEIPQDRRCRGRPQVRPDDETRQIIYEAARHAFAGSGYAATSMEAVARRAGVSTKTLYRLITNKASLFDGMVTDRLDRPLASVD